MSLFTLSVLEMAHSYCIAAHAATWSFVIGARAAGGPCHQR